MTHDMRQLISKVLRGPMIAALASGLVACDPPPSGDRIGDSFDKSVENVRQDLNKAADNAGRTKKEPHKTDGTFTEAGHDVKNIALAARVKAALTGARALDASKIDVGATTDGVVTLTGMAEDAMKRDLAQRLAWSVEGVTAVRNDIAIARGS